jgi:uncharacterized membrane protein
VEFLSLASLIALGMSIVSMVKFVRAKDLNSVVTQVVAWAVGIALVFLAGAADVTSHLVLFKGVPALGDINAASKVLLGMMFLSTGSQIHNFRKAFDNSQSSEEPAIVPPAKVITADGEAVAPARTPRPRHVAK